METILTNIRTVLDPEVCNVAEEIFWAEPTDRPGEYRVANLPCGAPIGLGDVVRVAQPRAGEIPQVIGIASRSTRLTLAVSVHSYAEFDSLDDAQSDPDQAEPARPRDHASLGGNPPVDEMALSQATTAVARAAREAGADVERVFPRLVMVRLPEGVGLNDEGIDDNAYMEWLQPMRPDVLREAEPLLPMFWLLVDPVSDPQGTDEGLVARLADRPPFCAEHEGGSPEPGWIAVHDRPTVMDKVPLGFGDATSDSVHVDDGSRSAASIHQWPVAQDDLDTEASNVHLIPDDILVRPMNGASYGVG